MKHPTIGANSRKNRNHDTLCYAGATPALREEPYSRAAYYTASAIPLSLLLTCCTPCELHDPLFSYGSSLKNVGRYVGGIYGTSKVIHLGLVLCWSFPVFDSQGKRCMNSMFHRETICAYRQLKRRLDVDVTVKDGDWKPLQRIYTRNRKETRQHRAEERDRHRTNCQSLPVDREDRMTWHHHPR